MNHHKISLYFTCFIVLIFLNSCVSNRQNLPPRPNIVMLLSDDLGFKDISCYGGPVKTPALDKLAATGTRFEVFYSGSAVCSPSRAVLLTGRHHIRTGVYSWIHDATQNSHLLESEITLAEILKKEGYSTAHIGKWHLGLPTESRAKPTPSEHGFDYWFATDNNAKPSHRNPVNFIRNGKKVGKIEGYSCQIVVDEAIKWLDNDRNKKSPFFLNIWFHEPHAPIAAPQEIVSQYGSKSREAIYSGTIDNTDRAIARLLKKLGDVDLPENTLIIYASDNGSYLNSRTGILRGKKGVNWEGGIRVPGIFNWPGHITKGLVSKQPAGLVDIVPTVCGLLKIDQPSDRHIDGSNLTPLLTGKQNAFDRHQPLFWHLQRSVPIVAMRDGDYSLVAFRDFKVSTSNRFKESWIPELKKGSYHNYQLYNLITDPSQQKDISKEHPALLEKLKNKLLKINKSILSEGPDWHKK